VRGRNFFFVGADTNEEKRKNFFEGPKNHRGGMKMKVFKKFYFCGLFLLVFFSFQSSYGLTNYVFFAVNGDTSLSSMVQGDTLSWGANCATGAQMYWQIWVDTDSDSLLDDPGDKLIFEFSISDGDTSSEGPPPDINPVPDGWYICQPFEAGIAPGYYIFKARDLTDSTTAQRGIGVYPLTSPPNKFTGWVTIQGHPAQDSILKNIWIEAEDSISNGSFWAGLTNDSGYYEINVGGSGTDHTFYIRPSDVTGFATPASQRRTASGQVDSVNFNYELPADSIFGQIRDQDDSVLAFYNYVWCSPRFSGAGDKQNESSDGNYKIYFGSSELGDWEIGVSSDYLVPNYLVPNSFQFNNQTQHGIEHNFTCERTDTVIYGRVTEMGGLPTHAYKIQAYSSLLSSSTEGISGIGSNNSFILHISSKDSSDWTVQLATWDDSYPIPAGYILEGGGEYNVSPGDTVVLNLISGYMVRDTIKLDPSDPGVVWEDVWVSLWAAGKSYGGNPDNNGVFTIYADTGSYSLSVNYSGYLSEPSSRSVLVSSDTTGGLGFVLNQAHARISGELTNVSLPLDPGFYVSAGTDVWPNGYRTSVEVDTLSGTFNLYVCDGDWTFYPPLISGYTSPPSQNLTISEPPDTLRTLNFSYTPSAVNEEEIPGALPENFVLSQNYPNPFNQSTELKYYIPEKVKSAFISLKIYNLLGQCLRTLVNENQSSGNHTAIWDGKDERGREVASGIYFYKLEAGDFKLTRRMVLLK
jgi:hypothetical protein